MSETGGIDESRRLLARCAYIPVLCLVPYVLEDGSTFVSLHARRGIVLFSLELVAGAVYFVDGSGPVLAACILAVSSFLALRGQQQAARGEAGELFSLRSWRKQ